MLRVKLPHLDQWNRSRRDRAATYRELLPGDLRLLEEREATECVYHLFPVRTPDRDELARRLGEAGVGTGVHYHPAASEQPPFSAGGGDHPVAAAWAAEELSLPMFEHMKREQVEHVAEVCAGALSPSG
jgi:dTDP-4-amino-4,6-dideoxygalactose transaminase